MDGGDTLFTLGASSACSLLHPGEKKGQSTFGHLRRAALVAVCVPPHAELVGDSSSSTGL